MNVGTFQTMAAKQQSRILGDALRFLDLLDLPNRDVFLGGRPRTHKIVIEEFCQIGRLEIKFGRLEII